MVDSLLHALPTARATGFRAKLGFDDGEPVVVTLHRPSNVDDPARLARIALALREIAADAPVVFPAHPRTRQRLAATNVDLGNVTVLDPVTYFEMLDLTAGARAVVTDSGGLQEETTVLGVPCFTVRYNTERPVTITDGTNMLTPEPEDVPPLVRTARRPADPRRPEGWDGSAGERVVDALTTR